MMYADDTTLFRNFDNIRNENTINNEINKVYRRPVTWRSHTKRQLLWNWYATHTQTSN